MQKYFHDVYFEDTYFKETSPNAKHKMTIFISSFNLIIQLKIHLTINLISASRSCPDMAYLTDNSIVIDTVVSNECFQYCGKSFYDLKF